MEQIEKGHNLFRIEREVRYQKGRGKLRIPYIAPKDMVIVNAKQLARFLETVDEELTSVIESARVQEEEFENREQARKEEEARQEQLRQNTGPTSLSYHTTTSTPLKTLAPYSTTSNSRQTSRGVLFNPNPTRHSYAYRGNTNGNDDYDQISGDSVSQDSDINDRISPSGNMHTNGEHRSDWQQGRTTGYGNRTTGTSSRTGLSTEQPQYQPRTPVICFRCGDPGHIRTTCQAADVYCTFCRTTNHNNKACKKYNNPNDSPTNSTSSQGYHPTATPPQGDTNGLFAPAKTSTAVQSPIPGTPILDAADITTAMTQAVHQGVSKAMGEGDVSKQMLKNLERFDGKDNSKCLEWLSNIEVIAQHSKLTFRELICKSMSPSLLHIFSSVSTFASDQDIKEILLANYSDVPSMAEAAAKLQNLQITEDEPLVTFNARYQQVHQVAYETSPEKQMNKTVIIDYVKKLPAYPRDKLLKKLSRKD